MSAPEWFAVIALGATALVVAVLIAVVISDDGT